MLFPASQHLPSVFPASPPAPFCGTLRVTPPFCGSSHTISAKFSENLTLADYPRKAPMKRPLIGGACLSQLGPAHVRRKSPPRSVHCNASLLPSDWRTQADMAFRDRRNANSFVHSDGLDESGVPRCTPTATRIFMGFDVANSADWGTFRVWNLSLRRSVPLPKTARYGPCGLDSSNYLGLTL